jgi:hypothetical protein
LAGAIKPLARRRSYVRIPINVEFPMRTLILAAAFAAAACPALADAIDVAFPECRNTPIAKMTRGELENCKLMERAMKYRDENIDKLLADMDRKKKQGPTEEECLAAMSAREHLRGCVYMFSGGQVRVRAFAPR